MLVLNRGQIKVRAKLMSRNAGDALYLQNSERRYLLPLGQGLRRNLDRARELLSTAYYGDGADQSWVSIGHMSIKDDLEFRSREF